MHFVSQLRANYYQSSNLISYEGCFVGETPMLVVNWNDCYLDDENDYLKILLFLWLTKLFVL